MNRWTVRSAAEMGLWPLCRFSYWRTVFCSCTRILSSAIAAGTCCWSCPLRFRACLRVPALFARFSRFWAYCLCNHAVTVAGLQKHWIAYPKSTAQSTQTLWSSSWIYRQDSSWTAAASSLDLTASKNQLVMCTVLSLWALAIAASALTALSITTPS